MSRPVRILWPLLLAAAALAVPAPAGAAVEVGLSEQDPAMFSSPRFERLQARHARVVVGWDVLRNGWERTQLDAWLAAADAAGVRPLVSFSPSRRKGRSKVLPSTPAFRREVRAFLRAYPRVRDFVTWNEANHVSQPTHDRPGRAAAYFDVLDAACRGCRVAAATCWTTSRTSEPGCARSSAAPSASRGSGGCTTTSTRTASRTRAPAGC